jgi:threonine dehydrogenase-like Zn-dependent dehydrogenase
LYGEVLSVLMVLPSAINFTLEIPDASEATALSVTDPVSVSPFSGVWNEIVGAVVSVVGVGTTGAATPSVPT